MKLKIRSWLFLLFFLFSAAAVIFPNMYFLITISHRMREMNRQTYTDSIDLVASTIDSYYERYAIDFIDIANSEEFKEIYHSDVLPIGDSPLTDKVRGKMSGDFCFLDLKYPDKIRNTWYTLKQVNHSVDVNLDIDAFLNSAPFLQMQESKEMKPLAGMLLSFYGYMLDKCLYFFCPIFENDEIAGVMIDIEKPDFIERLYDSNTSLRKGTIYIADQFDNVIHYNHPSSYDYYEYDNELKTYILEEDDTLYDPVEKMSFREYQLLNTDEQILKDSETLELVNTYRNGERLEPAVGTVEYKGKKYFAVYQKAPSSGMNVYYFYPFKLMASPLGHAPVWEFVIIFLILICLSLFLSMLCGNLYKKHINMLVKMGKDTFNDNFENNLKNKVPLSELIQTNLFHKAKTSAEQQSHDTNDTDDVSENNTKQLSVLSLKLDFTADELENIDAVISRFDKTMKHYSCTPVCFGANMYTAVCGAQTEKLLKAALACISFAKKHTKLQCSAGISTGKVYISEKSNNIFGKPVEEAFDLMLVSGAMKVTICENTYQRVGKQVKCTPIGCKSYQVEGFVNSQD